MSCLHPNLQLAFLFDEKLSSFAHEISEEHVDELRKKVQSQEIKSEKLKLEQGQLSKENSGLCIQNKKLAEEASYAKELTSVVVVGVKNLVGEMIILFSVKCKV
ncbi:hypothetical protein PVK06_031814 [Gossypium arboreum]|uniref:Uncharacterized protein n=1 Tax=Gossypium arboreum TaxID=29729 RepID=A0ABR0NSB8_GOSAR|nr:hypothetical protein PVK06_031814 [Gossypium arboreum]